MKNRSSSLNQRRMGAVSWVGSACAMLINGVAFAQAQDSSTTQSVELEEIVVTGSHIRGQAPVGSSVIALGTTDIAKSPGVTVADALRQLPQVSGMGMNEAAANTPGGLASNATRASAINLRGIGVTATLPLLDGFRLPANGIAGAFIDPNFLPTNAIQRVEIVADGASAIYGSDAISGVVNLIVRKDFEGAESRGRYSVADGYDSYQLGQLLGTQWDSGGAMIAYEYSKSSELPGSERDFYRLNLTDAGGRDYRVGTCNPGNILMGGVSYALPTPRADGTIDPNSLIAGTRNLCDTYDYNYILPEQERHSAVFHVHQDIGARASVYLQGFGYVRDHSLRVTSQGSAEQRFQLTVPNTNAYFVAPPGTNPTSLQVEYFFGPDYGQGLPQTGESEVFQARGGLRADLWGDWSGDVFVNYGESRDEYFNLTVDTAALNAALRSSDPATALNPFGRSNPALVNSLMTGVFNPITETTMLQTGARADGALFELPGGMVRAAIGAEYIEESRNAWTVRGTVAAPAPTAPIEDQRNVKSVHAEVLVPLVGAGNAVTGIQSLDLLVAGRYDDYSDVGSTSNPKIGLNWTPIDGLTIRGSYGTSFRAGPPGSTSLTALGAGVYVNPLVDPTSSTGSTIGLQVRSGNPDLKPETATTQSIGFDWQPSAVPGLVVGATYWSIDWKDKIESLRPSATLQPLVQPEVFGSLLIRNPSAAQVNEVLSRGLPLVGVLPETVGYLLDVRTQNIGRTKADGIDLTAAYAVPTSYGDFDFTLGGMFVTNFEDQLTPTSPLVDRLNTIGYPGSMRGRASMSWSNLGWNAGLYLNYVHSYDNVTVTPTQRVGSWTTADIHVGYSFENGEGLLSGLDLALDVRNLTDRDPVFVDIEGGYDPTNASPMGRLIGLSITKKW